MTVSETLLVFLGIPVGFMLLVTLLIFVISGPRSKRYRPDLTFHAAPVWFLAPETAVKVHRPALPSSSNTEHVQGGARDTW